MIRNFKQIYQFYRVSAFSFTGKTETGHKFTTPYLKLNRAAPVPAPYNNLSVPEGWTPEKFCAKIGGDMIEHYDKFESVEEMLNSKTVR